MMKFALLLSLITSSASFAPTPPRLCTTLQQADTCLQLQNNYLQYLEQQPALDGIYKHDDATHVISSANESSTMMSGNNNQKILFDYDPYAPGVAESYDLTDTTGNDGYDASSDSVGPGIYGGSVQRDATTGEILMGTRYEYDHHKPGPLYDSSGYSLMGRAIHAGPEKVSQLITDFPQLLEEISTGGAHPIHICGMSTQGQYCTQVLIDAGADIHALDSYDYNALHRMASNDLEVGAAMLVQAGLDPNSKVEGADSTPIEIAKRQRAIKFLMAMQRLGHYD